MPRKYCGQMVHQKSSPPFPGLKPNPGRPGCGSTATRTKQERVLKPRNKSGLLDEIGCHPKVMRWYKAHVWKELGENWACSEEIRRRKPSKHPQVVGIQGHPSLPASDIVFFERRKPSPGTVTRSHDVLLCQDYFPSDATACLDPHLQSLRIWFKVSLSLSA